MPSTEPITVRLPSFSFPDELDPVVIDGFPEESYTIVGLSLLLPYLEPYLIRSMSHAAKSVTDEALLADMDLFNAQEGQHYRQHARFNEAIRHRLPGRERLAALEKELDEDYHRFTKTRSLAWNLAYAEGFEAYTAAVARFSFEVGQLDRIEPTVRALFEWHLLEELEHRTVAFDVYEHVHGRYFYRLIVGLYAQWHLNRFVMRASHTLDHGDLEAFRTKYGGAARARSRLLPLIWSQFRKLLPKVLATYLPWYTPHRIAMPERLKAVGEKYATPSKQPS